MRIEKWNYKGEEVDIPILEEGEIEKKEEVNLDNTLELTSILKDMENKDEK